MRLSNRTDMHHIEERYLGTEPATATLTLTFDRRQKSRFRSRLDNGNEVAITLERGTALRQGDLLRTTEGQVVRVVAAPETLSVARSTDPLTLCRAAYHLGNRHMPLQIGSTELCYQHDHVLDDMVRQLGLDVAVEERPFEPESGAYGSGHAHVGGGHSHGQGHIHHHHGADSDASNDEARFNDDGQNHHHERVHGPD